MTPLQFVEEYKYIHDNVHGYIPISNYAERIINSEEFQRLRKIKQLGTCEYAYPNAIHTRFIHSIGTYYLAGKILERIVKNSDMKYIREYLQTIEELKHYFERKYSSQQFVLDEYVRELIKIGALCHDLGHGPFSHLFDDYFIPHVKHQHQNDTHEERSKLLIIRIIKKDSILSTLIKDTDLAFICSIINPTNKNKGFLYQIVSNSLTGLDVDKFDYITRDSYMLGLKSGFDYRGLIDHVRIIENNLAYPERMIHEIKRLYEERYSLHKKVYNHKTVIGTQLMIIELFKILDPILNLAHSVENMDEFIKLTDEYIFTIVDHRMDLYKELAKYDAKYVNYVERLNCAKEIITRINNHDI